MTLNKFNKHSELFIQSFILLDLSSLYYHSPRKDDSKKRRIANTKITSEEQANIIVTTSKTANVISQSDTPAKQQEEINTKGKVQNYPQLTHFESLPAFSVCANFSDLPEQITTHKYQVQVC